MRRGSVFFQVGILSFGAQAGCEKGYPSGQVEYSAVAKWTLDRCPGCDLILHRFSSTSSSTGSSQSQESPSEQCLARAGIPEMKI